MFKTLKEEVSEAEEPSAVHGNFTYFKINNVIRKYLENHALSAYVYFNAKNTLHLAS